MNKQYQYNLLFLWFNDRDTERRFNLNSFQDDLQALRFVIILGTALSIIFIFVDVIRYNADIVSIGFRGGVALLLVLFGALTFIFKKNEYKFSQLLGVIVAVVVSSVFFIQYHLNDDPAFDIFLSNIIMVLIFITSTIMGMRFRYALMINSVNFISYILYIQNINYSLIAERQISQLFVIYMVGNFASYLLDRQKMTSFINKDKLRLEVQKVDELNEVKNKLFSIISHDLRGPIRSLKSILGLYRKKAITIDEFKKLTCNLENDVQNSSNLIDNLLAWSKSQLQGLEIRKTSINLREDLQKLQELFHTQLESKSLKFELSIADNHQIYADKENVQIVFRNLISNAIKFTPVGGRILIFSSKMNNKFLEIKISDSGVGIPPEKISQLFKLNKDILIGTSSASGAGIGLLLVKEFVELNSGKVSVGSSTTDGTTFIVMLPSD